MRRFLSTISLISALTMQLQGQELAEPGGEPLAGQFAAFNKRNLQEKIFVHTDKEFYLAGEIVWYKIYYMDGVYHRPLDLSKLAYVEIIDQNNRPVMQGKNALKNSAGRGSFYLPSSVNSGSYKLRAYTNWMKNFDAGYYFEKNISIVNSLKPLNLPAAPPAKKFDISFFPEGGSMVSGLENRIAFKFNDQYGSGANFSGIVVDNNNDTIISFRPYRFGMGSFLFTPSSDKSYKALISIEGAASITVDLPLVVPTGYVMRTEDNNDGNYKITLTTNLLDRLHGAEIVLLAHTRQQTKFTERKKTANGVVSFLVKKELLDDGVSQLTLFNRELQPIGERLVFKAPKQEAMFTASLDATSFKTRNAVDVNVSTVSGGKPVPANLSLAVYQLDSLSVPPSMDIRTYLYLHSDIRGSIESPEYYFSNDPAAGIAADNLMMTQGWRRFTWNQPLRRTPLPYDYAPEFDGHIVSATVNYTSKQQPAAGLKAYLSVPGNKTQFYASITDANGKAWFDIRDYYGRNEIVVQVEALSDTNYRVDISDPFSERYSVKPFKQFGIDGSQKSVIQNHSISMQALNAYTGDSLTRFDIPRLDSSPFYGKYTKRYLLDDYVRFTTMEEVLREYVPEVGIKRTAGQPRLRIADWDQLKYLEGDPLLLFDGVPVTHKQILAYDPLKVRKLEVVTNRYITGKFVFDGIASFNSYAGDMPDFVFDTRTVLADYEGLQLEREFYSPKYETESQRTSRIGDFRDLLTWQPDITTDTSGKIKTRFYTSDKKGKFIGVLQGIDANGHAASHVFSFEVTR